MPRPRSTGLTQEMLINGLKPFSRQHEAFMAQLRALELKQSRNGRLFPSCSMWSRTSALAATATR